MTDLSPWVDISHYLNLYPRDHPDHPSNFGDTVYHTCVAMIGMHLSGQLTPMWLDRFAMGTFSRVRADGEFIRSPWVDTPMNRDQVIFMPYCLHLIDENQMAEALYKKYAGLAGHFPHQKMNLHRSIYNKKSHFSRYIADLAEQIDLWMDTFGEISESSVHKNIVRICIMYYNQPSSRMDPLIKYFNKHFNAWEIMTEYHTRYWAEQPPIHLIYKPVIREVFG